MLLAIADGQDYQSAAQAAGRKSGDAVSPLVSRFNREGLAALALRHAGGRVSIYDEAARQRILREVKRTPTPEADGTATWSLMTLRRALRSAPAGLSKVWKHGTPRPPSRKNVAMLAATSNATSTAIRPLKLRVSVGPAKWC